MIAEQQWQIGNPIKFTKFDSCIGVVAALPDEKMIIGIHLVLIPKGKTAVMSPGDVGMVGAVLTRKGYRRENPLVIAGQVSTWTSQASKTLAALSALALDPGYKDTERGKIEATWDGTLINIKMF